MVVRYIRNSRGSWCSARAMGRRTDCGDRIGPGRELRFDEPEERCLACLSAVARMALACDRIRRLGAAS